MRVNPTGIFPQASRSSANGPGFCLANSVPLLEEVRNVNDSADDDPYGWRCEGRDLLRAVAGGAIVGMPLLYTMEMWEHGMSVSDWHLLALLGAMLVVNFLFSLLSGFREEYSVTEAISESITGVGIALALSAGILWVIGELSTELSRQEVIGKVLIEAAAVSLGISFANAQMQKSRTGDEAGGGGDSAGKKPPPGAPAALQLRADLREMVAALAGSTVFALNVAPTEEITLIAARLSPWQQLALLAVSVTLCYIILFAAQFREHAVHVESVFQTKGAETLLTCAISLTVAAGLLLLHGHGDAMQHFSTGVAAIVTLGLPAMVGGAAGRLIA
ncbi:MAG: TIGR02587 family membrane protein [Verrucomicrobiota bacterium]|nr:TIGR02587 family membrane protein [Verrucomicrobiota bacterium]